MNAIVFCLLVIGVQLRKKITNLNISKKYVRDCA